MDNTFANAQLCGDNMALPAAASGRPISSTRLKWVDSNATSRASRPDDGGCNEALSQPSTVFARQPERGARRSLQSVFV